MSAYLVYLSWKIRAGWKQSSASSPPYKYASDQVHFQPQKGDTVWVVSCPRWDQDRLPPTLIARLETIRDCVDLFTATDVSAEEWAFCRYGRYLAVSDQGHGEYFPVNNLYNVLLGLEFSGGKSLSACLKCSQAEANPAEPFYTHIPSHLQTIRRLTSSDEARLQAQAEAVRLQRNLFLSYRHVEAADTVRQFASLLRLGGGAYWLDAEMIRYRASSGQAHIPWDKLAQYLSDGIRQSFVFVAFVTATYLERDWIRFELEQAERYHREGHVNRLVAIYLDPQAGDLPFAAEEIRLSAQTGEQRERRLAELARSLLE